MLLFIFLDGGGGTTPDILGSWQPKKQPLKSKEITSIKGRGRGIHAKQKPGWIQNISIYKLTSGHLQYMHEGLQQGGGSCPKT